ncbi:MAG: hypothetical protein H8D45_20815 [Bacteroidetes bacterium]|nr:hypothetical protein [Bacteroidota bacterium]
MGKKQWGHGYYTGYEEGKAEIIRKIFTTLVPPKYPLYNRWEKFFKKIGWTYKYRPFNINNWSPTFAIEGTNQTTLVDVRYGTSMDDFVEIARDEVYPNVKNTPYEESEVLFLTSAIFKSGHSFNDFPVIGWLDDNMCGIDEAILNCYNNCYGFFHTSGSWRDRITGLYDGNHKLSPPDKQEVFRLWNAAEISE